jgi:hypothetical protein
LIRTVSRHSLAYMLCAASEMFRHYDFDRKREADTLASNFE